VRRRREHRETNGTNCAIMVWWEKKHRKFLPYRTAKTARRRRAGDRRAPPDRGAAKAGAPDTAKTGQKPQGGG